MAWQPPEQKRFDPKELTSLLMDYWLVTPESPMMAVIDQVVKAHRTRTPLRVSYDKFPALDIRNTLSALGVPVANRESVLRDSAENVLWDAIGNDNKVEVPGLTERQADFELILPFTLEKLRREDRKPAYGESQVEALFVLSLVECLDSNVGNLTTLPPLEIPDTESRRFRRFYRITRQCSPLAALYLGLVPGMDRYSQIPTEKGIEGQWFNRHAKKADQDEYDRIWKRVVNNRACKHPSRSVHLNRLVNFKVRDIGSIVRNLTNLNKETDSPEDYDERRRLGDVTFRNFCKGRFHEFDVFDSRKFDKWVVEYRKLEIYLRSRISNGQNKKFKLSLGFSEAPESRLEPQEVFKRHEMARKRLFAGQLEPDSELRELAHRDDALPRDSESHSAKPVTGTVGDVRKGGVKEIADIFGALGIRRPTDLKWPDVTIRFVSDHNVQVGIGHQAQEVSFRVMGFEDKRKRDVPNSRWLIFERMATNNGLLSTGSDAHDQAKSAIRDIRFALRKRFGIQSDPFEYRREHGWSAKFRLSSNTTTQTEINLRD